MQELSIYVRSPCNVNNGQIRVAMKMPSKNTTVTSLCIRPIKYTLAFPRIVKQYGSL